jgi:hypothetical protein
MTIAPVALADGHSDRSELAPAFRAVRARLGLVVLLLAVAAVAWWSTADRMAGMDAGPGTDLGALGWFLGVWVVMMAAMMFPSLAPTVALYTTMTPRRGPDRPLLFTIGYLFVWGAAGLGAYGLFELGKSLCGGALAWHAGGRWLAAGVLAVAAVYELTPLKHVCLGKCRSPLGSLLGTWRDGRLGAVGDGLRTCRLVPGMLLGADGSVVRARRDERRLDGVRRRADRAREDASVAPGCDLGHRRHPARARCRDPRRPACSPRPGRPKRLARRDAGDERDALARLPWAGAPPP